MFTDVFDVLQTGSGQPSDEALFLQSLPLLQDVSRLAARSDIPPNVNKLLLNLLVALAVKTWKLGHFCLFVNYFFFQTQDETRTDKLSNERPDSNRDHSKYSDDIAVVDMEDNSILEVEEQREPSVWENFARQVRS